MADRSADTRIEGSTDREELSPATCHGKSLLDRQSEAVAGFRNRHGTRARAIHGRGGQQATAWKRVTLTLPRAQAQQKAREFLRKYPKAAYWSEVESWRELPGDIIEFTMRRLPTAD